MRLGTPKSFNEAIANAICIRPPNGIDVQSWIRGVFKDYLAQKFCVAMLKCHTPEQEALVSDLWKSIFDEKFSHNVPENFSDGSKKC